MKKENNFETNSQIKARGLFSDDLCEFILIDGFYD